jgi:DNA-binding CsgD family transcriptional regulator
MTDVVDRRTALWAAIVVAGGIALFVGLELREEPGMSALDLALELLQIVPVVMTSVGLALLVRVTLRQRDEQLTLIRDLEVARAQGQRWRSDARAYINGLGDAIEVQFSRWNLTEAEREVALLLLKGLSLKEIASIRATNERTVRAQARSLYAKAGLTGRAALSAFFLEDLLAPTVGAE